jgi:hypothetical protein
LWWLRWWLASWVPALARRAHGGEQQSIAALVRNEIGRTKLCCGRVCVSKSSNDGPMVGPHLGKSQVACMGSTSKSADVETTHARHTHTHNHTITRSFLIPKSLVPRPRPTDAAVASDASDTNASTQSGRRRQTTYLLLVPRACVAARLAGQERPEIFLVHRAGGEAW